MTASYRFIKWFEEIGIDDIPLVGGKNASLGEMYRELSAQGIKIPNGFAITADAYKYYLGTDNLGQQIGEILATVRPDDLDSLQESGKKIRQAILGTEFPRDLKEEILHAYHDLAGSNKCFLDVAVRSSATAEDLPDASFAGQQETYLNIEGDEALIDACRKCFASTFTDRAILYRHTMGYSNRQVALSIGIQKMVRSDTAVSGVMFTIDTENGFRDLVIINASYGLGENIVKGSINPDEFYIFKPTLKQGFKPIFRRSLGSKEFKLVYDVGGNKMVKNVPTSTNERETFCISDEEVLQLSAWACVIEDHYSKKRDTYTPMDIEWAKDGKTGELFIVQARPETVQALRNNNELVQYVLNKRSERLLKGKSVGERICAGPVRVIEDAKDLALLKEGEVLVADKTDPDWEPAMKKASAIITNRGGRTCHAAIVSRELGVAALVGTANGTKVLRDGEIVTVSCAEGEEGYVYKGQLDYGVHKISLDTIPRTKTKIMMNVGDPGQALKYSLLPNDGVGLARIEFIITSTIGIHPMALVEYERLQEPLRAEINALTSGYMEKTKFFIDRLAEGIATIAAAFYPKEVIVRLSDFKTNEYANLLGGEHFEPKEENPMLGFRGASRYYNPRYQAGFALECEAVKKVREEMGFVNVKIMVPFCRTVEEGRLVIAELKKNGLTQGKNGLEVYVMCEIPSNVLLAAEFAEVFDGFSIGSNDLTQLVLGVDRESEIISSVFDERDLSVKKMIREVIRVAKEKKKKIGICGQAPSDYPDFARFLVRERIGSISLNPDSIVKTTILVAETERELQSINCNLNGGQENEKVF